MTYRPFLHHPIGQFPHYPHETEYLTGSPTYTDDLARKTEFMRYLGHRVWEYDKEMALRLAAWDKNLEDFPEDVKKLLQQWMDDGTLDEIINEHIFSMKADKTWVEQIMGDLQDEINAQLDRLKEGTVYVTDFGAVGDGVTNDAPAIQAAFNVASGKTVVFPDRIFLIANIIKVKSHTRVKLQPDTILRRGANINTLFLNDSDGTKGGYSANQDIHFEGGTLDVNKLDFPSKCTPFGFGHCENISIKNMNFVNMWQWHYIEYSACKNTLTEGCTFDGHDRDTASEHVQFDVHKSDTTFPWFGPYDGTACLFGTVRDCLFKNGRRGVGTHSYVEGNPQRHITIVNNRFENMRDYGIGTYDYQDCLISGNSFKGGLTAIYIMTSVKGNTKNINIRDNFIEDMNLTEHGRGIHINDYALNVTISGNTIHNVARHGIGYDRSEYGSISDNIVTDCGRSGLYVYGSFNTSITGNVFQENNTLQMDEYDLRLGDEGIASATDLAIIGNEIGTLGIERSLNAGIFHNHIASFTIGEISSDLLMKDNCVNGVWV